MSGVWSDTPPGHSWDNTLIYFFPFDVDFVCAKALPATLLEFELYLPSRRIAEALEATDLLVCLVFAKRITLLFIMV